VSLRVHAICLALNEEPFIREQLKCLYPFCTGISIVSQYDRDWYGKRVNPDATIKLVADYPDPEGKIHLVVRRFPDETAARNHEMLALNDSCARGITPHGRSKEDVKLFHRAPDYFFIVDADELYDINSLPRILEYLEKTRPKGLRVLGYNYVRTWNRRVPQEVIEFRHFGFVRAGTLFEQRRVVTWNESRLAKLFKILKVPDYSSRLFGFIDCPPDVGVFHHACWLGDDTRLRKKINSSSHPAEWTPDFSAQLASIQTKFIPRNDLPQNIREGDWPAHFFED
jgi:hypothetical protein